MDDGPLVNIEAVEDALTTSRKGVRMPQIEVITRGERRRVWSLEQKREIVVESLGPALTPTEVARKHAISSGLLDTGGGRFWTSRWHWPPSAAELHPGGDRADAD